MTTALGLWSTLSPFLHFGGFAATLAFPPLAFLGNGRWKLILAAVLALILILVIGGMWVRIEEGKVALAERDVTIAGLNSSIEATKAAQAVAIAEANIKAVADLQKRHAAELAATKRQRDQAVAEASRLNMIKGEIDRADDAKLPIARALVPLLVRRADP